MDEKVFEQRLKETVRQDHFGRDVPQFLQCCLEANLNLAVSAG
jgi:hypothetical protein